MTGPPSRADQHFEFMTPARSLPDALIAGAYLAAPIRGRFRRALAALFQAPSARHRQPGLAQDQSDPDTWNASAR